MQEGAQVKDAPVLYEEKLGGLPCIGSLHIAAGE